MSAPQKVIGTGAAPAKAGSDWAAIAQQASVNPLMVVPADVRRAVSRLWLCNQHLFPSALAISCTVRDYLEAEDVTADDVNAICEKLMRPAVRALHKFPADLIADLSRYVAEFAARNKSRREADGRQQEADRFKAATKIDAGDLFKFPG